MREEHAARIETLHLHVVQRDRHVLGVDEPDRRLPVDARQRACRDRDTGCRCEFHAALDRRAEEHRRWRVDQADTDTEGPGDGIGLGIHLPDPAGGGDGRIVGQRHHDLGIGWRRADHLRGYVEHGVTAILPGDLKYRLSRLDDFACLRHARGDRPCDPCFELGVADAVLGDVQLGLGIVELRLSRAQGLLRPVVQGLGREALGQQDLLLFEGVARLGQAAFGGRERRLGRPQGVQLVLRIELGEHLVGLDAVADVAQSFSQCGRRYGRTGTPRSRR